MSIQLHNGNGRDVNVLDGHSLAVSSITGSYTATIVSGAGAGTILATDSTGGATYGPYATSVVIRIRASAIAIIDYDSALAPSLTYRSPIFGASAIPGDIQSVVDADGNAFLRGALESGEWTTVPSIFRLRFTGTGTVVMDSRDSLGVETLAVAAYTAAGATDQIEFPFAGDNAVAIRVTLTGTVTCEVI